MTADNTPNMQYRITAFGLGAILVTSAIVFIFGNTAGHSALAGTFPGANGKIAFVSDRDGNLEIYTMDSDGSNQKRLTNNAAADDFPSWSPDGSKIAFASSRDGNNEIYVMNADGTNQVRLTNDAASDTEPTWSPEGTRIAFVRDNLDLYVMNSDSTNIVGLTTSFVDFYEANTPSWSPDGKTIAFACYDETVRRSDMANLCFIAPDGSNFMHILPDCTDNGDWDPSWSPDSSKIAFTSRNRDTICSNDGSGWGNEILVLNLETMGWTDILEEDHDFYGPDFEQPSWSPDGAQIAFACVFACVPGEGVYVMNSDGSNMHKLAADAAASPRPDWGLATTTSTVSECDNPTIVGTDGADVIDGTSRVDVI
ncbi:MAG TPA: DPP IV N-terminal domain-containing protein, partial [Nitrososphaera sp.]|nr:DPP IV N-terminal domain-containing protein [Nitrososphaera sp.]